MARGDVRPTISHSSRGSWGRSSISTSFYDDQGRGDSKRIWEWFEETYTANNYAKTWLMGLDDDTCYRMVRNSTSRFGLMDIIFVHDVNGDTRARRLVTKHLQVQDWNEFHKHVVDGYNRVQDRINKEHVDRAEQQRAEWAAYEAQRKAEAAIVERNDYEAIQKLTEMSVGMLSSELNQAVQGHDTYGPQGDWIDDAGELMTGGDGFGIEERRAVGVKIQITLSLDLSNSMYYNSIHRVAAETFRDLGFTLLAMKNEHPDDLYVGLFTFSDDNYTGKGKLVRQLKTQETPSWMNEPEHDFHGLDLYRPSKMNEWYGSGPFDGTDTYISPLFEAIENWEKESSDPGAVRLDLVITDAVLEHPTDIRNADTVQERRDGTLQTVLLNFMPETEWLGSTLPKRCFQMSVGKDNVAGILRNVLAEFLAVNM